MSHFSLFSAFSSGRCALALAALTALAGCSSLGQTKATLGSMVTPYKADIQQGNVITREQVKALQVGMKREQVRAVLGTSLLASVFHADRWDYVFTFRRQGQEPQQRKLVVFFKDDALSSFEAGELPTEAEFVASLDVRAKSDKPPVLQATPEELKAFESKNPSPAAVPVPVAASAAPAASYPPLESR